MDERVKRMLKKGCPTEDIRLWGGMAHRVVELTGPMDTPDDLRIELFLHDESAFRLLDMCDAVDEKFEAVVAENERLRKELLYVQTHWELDRCPNCEARLDSMVQRDESDGLYRRYAQAVVEAEIWNEQWEAEHIENGKLRDALAKALRIQSQYCDNMDAQYCKNECPLYRRETGDCDACDVISDAFDLGVYK